MAVSVDVQYPIVLTQRPTVWRGDPFLWRLWMVDSEGEPVDLSGYGTTWAATARTQLRSAVGFDFTVDISSLATGLVTISLTGTQTNAMRADKYGFDVQASGGSESPFTVWTGSLKCDGDWTHA